MPNAPRELKPRIDRNGGNRLAAVADRRGKRHALGQLYDRVYALICGSHPNLRPWHFQWLAARQLYRDLKRILPAVDGRLLDVGCETKPYARWLNASRVVHVGADIAPGPQVDVVLPPSGLWPFADGSFDSVLCTQVLEHVESPRETLSEIRRVLRTGGALVVSVPFIYNEHGLPLDFRRFSKLGIVSALEDSFEVSEVRGQGGIGSALGILILNWLDLALDQGRTGRMIKGIALPVWIILGLVVNLFSIGLDTLDKTGRFYGNVLVVGRRRP